MKYSFKELVEVPRLQDLTDELYAATGIPSAIITTDGDVLTGSGWQRICTQFHRMHPLIEQECIASDIAIRKGLNAGEPYVLYRCPRGLVDASSPVVIEGEHVANVFVGQLFTEAPDGHTERFFREQARKFGLDEAAYLAAYREVPVVSEAQFRPALSFLAKFARLVASIGLARRRELEAGDALRAAEAKYRIVAEHTLDWEFWLSPAGRYVYVSPSCGPMTGHAPGAFEADPGLAIRLVHHRDRPLYVEHVRRALTERRPAEVVFRIVRPDGTERWIEHICRPIRDADGVFLGTRGSNRDITERRRAEAAVQRSEAALRRAQEVAKVGSWVWHVRGNRLEWSDEMFRIFGIERAQFSGDLGEVVARAVHPDDRAAVERANRLVVEGGRPTPVQYRVVRPDGTERTVWTEAGDLVRDDAGQPERLSGIVQDITERVQAEEALRVSEEQFRRIFDLSPVPIALVRPDLRFERCNSAFCQFLGYEEGELQGRIFQEFTYPEDLDVGLTVTRAVLSGAQDVGRVEKRYFHRSGKVVWGGLTIRLVRDSRGRPVHFLTVLQDLTARKEAEQALQRSEARFRAIFDDSPIAIFEEDFSGVRAALDALHAAGVTDLHAFLVSRPDEVQRLAGLVRILDVNAASVRTLEATSREELVGEMARPAGEGARLSFTEELVALDSGRAKFSGEFAAVSRTGRPMWLEISLAVQPGSESTLARVLVSFVDITARKRADEALRESHDMIVKLTAQVPGVVYQYRLYPDGRSSFPFASPGMNDIYEVTPGEVREDATPVFGRLHPADADRVGALIQESARTLQPFHCEFRVVLPRQGLRWRLSDALPERLEDGGTLWYGIISDVTDRKRAEQAIHDLNSQLEARVSERTAQLEAANREMESFTFSVSHDLRAPLRAIDGYATAFAEDFGADLAPGAREYLGSILGGTRRMSQLVDGLLALSRLGRQQLHVETIEAADIVRTALADAGAREREGRVDIVVGALPACRADGTLLRQVFVNLLQNAFKFAAGREAARVEVGCRGAGGGAVFYVRDNGVGFDMRYADRLFQPFQRLHNATEFPGNGVGLAIVHRIVERHGGRVWAESAPGQGATFFFTIGEVAAGG